MFPGFSYNWSIWNNYLRLSFTFLCYFLCHYFLNENSFVSYSTFFKSMLHLQVLCILQSKKKKNLRRIFLETFFWGSALLQSSYEKSSVFTSSRMDDSWWWRPLRSLEFFLSIGISRIWCNKRSNFWTMWPLS